MPQHNTIL